VPTDRSEGPASGESDRLHDSDTSTEKVDKIPAFLTVDVSSILSAEMGKDRMVFSEIDQPKNSYFFERILKQKTTAAAPDRPSQLSAAIGSNWPRPSRTQPIAGAVGQTAIYATQFVPA